MQPSHQRRVTAAVALSVIALFTAPQFVETCAAQAVPAATTGSSADFQVYKTRIEPIFLKEREGGVMCYNCHSVLNTRLRLQTTSAASGFSWTEEQSRLNFAVVSQLVTPGDPSTSRLLLHPLAPEAGGDPFHTGGKFWKSRDDPEWQMIAEWVRGLSAGASPTAPASSAPTAAEVLDFEFFKTRVEPIFLERRPGHTRCYACHRAYDEVVVVSGPGDPNATALFHLRRLAPGSTFWTEEQSRLNFGVVTALVAPGDPVKSRLLMHPLAPEAGGDRHHGGGRQFTSEDDPDWVTLSQWVLGTKVSKQ
jgi:hypothetical protein